jgi:hypothetical protein
VKERIGEEDPLGKRNLLTVNEKLGVGEVRKAISLFAFERREPNELPTSSLRVGPMFQ